MSTPTGSPQSRKRTMIAAAGMAAGGLVPLVTGMIGIWSYYTNDYIEVGAGTILAGLSGVVASGFFLLAGLWMIAYAVRLVRRHRKKTE